jgi:hypothetical protein
MYGSLLSGGLGGHIYGAGGWRVGQRGLWSGEVEEGAECPIWEAVRWPSGDDLRHLKAFVLSEGTRYRDLEPAPDMLRPNRSGKPDGLTGWAFSAATPDGTCVAMYFEAGCPVATVRGLAPGRVYRAAWFDPRTGADIACDGGCLLAADSRGELMLPPFPDGSDPSETDWALRLTLGARGRG